MLDAHLVNFSLKVYTCRWLLPVSLPVCVRVFCNIPFPSPVLEDICTLMYTPHSLVWKTATITTATTICTCIYYSTSWRAHVQYMCVQYTCTYSDTQRERKTTQHKTRNNFFKEKASRILDVMLYQLSYWGSSAGWVQNQRKHLMNIHNIMVLCFTRVCGSWE